MRRTAAAIALVVIAACGRHRTAPRVAASRDGGGAGGAVGGDDAGTRAAGPADLPHLPITETGDQAMAAMAAHILHLSRQVVRNPDVYPKLVGDLLEHARVTGRLDDYLAADAESARWVAAAPGLPAAHMLRARIDATLHRFADAAAELDRARAAGASAADVAHQRVDLDQATGKLEPALAARRAEAARYPNMISLTMLALALDLHGEAHAGRALMPKALATWRDVSAPPFAWFLFQWARLAEDDGDRDAARAFYGEAHRRMPRYGDAGRHLAALMIDAGDDAGARAVLEELATADSHPETTAMLADIAARAGDPRAAGLRETARAGWERYLAALPAAFSDHAARFYLGVGRDPARALELAEANLANRDTAEAQALVIDAALAAGKPARACAVADRLDRGGPAPRRFRFSAWKGFGRCGRTGDAARLARALGIADGAP
jgi:tetratricopeptide (TPR) repeat protein